MKFFIDNRSGILHLKIFINRNSSKIPKKSSSLILFKFSFVLAGKASCLNIYVCIIQLEKTCYFKHMLPEIFLVAVVPHYKLSKSILL